MSLNNEHAARLREMAQQELDMAKTFTPMYSSGLIASCRADAAALLAGAEALEAVEVAAQAERMANTDTVRAMGPHFCDFFFSGPGAADYLQQQLAAACREAAAEALFGLKDSIRGGTYRPHVAWRCISTRAAALRAGKGVQDAE
jgi:hypothetical protein